MRAIEAAFIRNMRQLPVLMRVVVVAMVVAVMEVATMATRTGFWAGMSLALVAIFLDRQLACPHHRCLVHHAYGGFTRNVVHPDVIFGLEAIPIVVISHQIAHHELLDCVHIE
jgi:Na+-transporting NADH:ubiquinone oxidoreductase subunit NqrB